MQSTKTAKKTAIIAANEFFDVQAKLISVDAAARLTGISAWTWRSWVYTGRIASVKAGRNDKARNCRLLIPVTEVRRILAEGYRPRFDVREKARA